MFRVPLGTMVSFESSLSFSKRLELTCDKAKKGATIEDVTSMRPEDRGLQHVAWWGGGLPLQVPDINAWA